LLDVGEVGDKLDGAASKAQQAPVLVDLHVGGAVGQLAPQASRLR
jgi:hypothetical protein